MTNYLAAKLSRRLVQRSPAMRDEDGSAAKPDQFWGPSNPLMYRFVSKVRTDPFLVSYYFENFFEAVNKPIFTTSSHPIIKLLE